MPSILPCRLWKRCLAVCLPLALAAWLGGCAAPAQQGNGTPPVTEASSPVPATPAASGQALNQDLVFGLLKQAETAPSPQRESLLLQASAYYRQQGDYTRMGRVLHEVHADALTDPLRADYSLQYGDWAIDQRRLDDAGRVLLDPALDKGLNDVQLATLHGLRARLFELQGKPMDALNERMAQSLRTPEAQQGELSTVIWRLLAQLSDTDMQFLESADTSNRPEEQLLAGWLALARIQRNDAGNVARQTTDVQDWQRSYPMHPANRHLPADMAVAIDASSPGNLPRRIALLLPLTGKRADAGQALRDGFMTMHYQQLSGGKSDVQVDLVDTGTSPDILNTYQQAVAQGAQLVIGPLEREQVQLLASQASLPVPTLALNNPLTATGRAAGSELYQFSLNPEDDVTQVADAAAASRLRKALVIAPQGERGERLVQAFLRRWQQAGGDAGQVRYSPGSGNYSAAIAEGLGVDLASGQLRAGKTLPDMVFFVGTGSDASGVMEALSRNGAATVPVYATSQVLGGRLDARTNGLRVCLPPWQAGAGPLRAGGTDVPAGNNAALFAMGADAEALYPQLTQLGGNSSLHIPGNTGYLGMDDSHRVVRTLVWAILQDGQPVVQPATANGRF